MLGDHSNIAIMAMFFVFVVVVFSGVIVGGKKRANE